MADEEYLNMLSAPRIEPGGKSKKKPTPKRQRTLPEEESGSAAEVRPPANAKASPKGKGKKTAEIKE